MDRPLCKCHGEPMLRNGIRYRRQAWRCAAKKSASAQRYHWTGGGQEHKRRRYEARKQQGLCTRCSQPALSEALCWDCLNEMEANRALGL